MHFHHYYYATQSDTEKKYSGYKFTISQEKINYLIYMDDIKLFAKYEKEVKTLKQIIRIYNQDIGMEFGMGKCTMLIIKSGKSQTTEEI